jgi:hypothetical protein
MSKLVSDSIFSRESLEISSEDNFKRVFNNILFNLLESLVRKITKYNQVDIRINKSWLIEKKHLLGDIRLHTSLICKRRANIDFLIFLLGEKSERMV